MGGQKIAGYARVTMAANNARIARIEYVPDMGKPCTGGINIRSILLEDDGLGKAPDRVSICGEDVEVDGYRKMFRDFMNAVPKALSVFRSRKTVCTDIGTKGRSITCRHPKNENYVLTLKDEDGDGRPDIISSLTFVMGDARVIVDQLVIPKGMKNVFQKMFGRSGK